MAWPRRVSRPSATAWSVRWRWDMMTRRWPRIAATNSKSLPAPPAPSSNPATDATTHTICAVHGDRPRRLSRLERRHPADPGSIDLSPYPIGAAGAGPGAGRGAHGRRAQGAARLGAHRAQARQRFAPEAERALRQLSGHDERGVL